MYYAQVKNSVVVNVIRLDDTSLEGTFSAGFDHFVNLGATRDAGQPGPGWNYDSETENFSPPESEE